MLHAPLAPQIASSDRVTLTFAKAALPTDQSQSCDQQMLSTSLVARWAAPMLASLVAGLLMPIAWLEVGQLSDIGFS